MRVRIRFNPSFFGVDMTTSGAPRSIRKVILLAAILASLVLVGAAYLFAFSLFERATHQQAKVQANALEQLTFQNMYQVMSQGWTRAQLTAFLANTRSVYRQSGMSIDLYRSELVEAQFGALPDALEEGERPAQVTQAFRTGSLVELTNDVLRDSFFPLQAEERCLGCHSQATVGAVLGVMHIRQDMSAADDALDAFLIFFLLLLPLPLVVAWWVSGYIARWLGIAVDRLSGHIEQIVKVRDLSAIQGDAVLSEWQELRPLAQALQQLAGKLQTVAVDRDILEFEIRLLDKFMITSEVVRDWKEHIVMLMQEINTILPMYALFVVFRTDEEERFALEIFWAGEPTSAMRTHFELYARECMALHPLLGRSALLDVYHSVVDPRHQIDEDPTLIEVQTKNLLLDTPKIGGVVGIGVQSMLNQDLTRAVVIESILTTLINVVGSIKAINKYTRDLEFYATRDPLTHLYNQRVFHEMLDHEVGRAERNHAPFTLMMCDFDNFKLINDQFGHMFGDNMLQAFARAVAAQLRHGDVFSRYGGDEFCVIFPETNLEQAHEVALQVMSAIRAVSEPLPDGGFAYITCSLGLACFPEHAQNAEDLFLIADNMMYKAKASGKNQIMLPSDEDVSAVYREVTQKSFMLIQALEAETFIEPHFQPILTVQTGEVVIHELLMRIRQGDRLVAAGEFIELAERMGIVHKLDYLLIKKAFAVMEASQYTGKLFINLSPRALILNEFVEQIKTMAHEHHIVPERIVFEITERDTVSNLSALEKFVRELKFEGFQFAIDDFGSGFSSFHYLKHFPVDYLKIEGEFIGNMTKDYIDKAFVQSAVTLAQAVGIETVAEFVEDAHTLQMVRDMGIHYAQGWFISCAKPTFMTQVPDVVIAALAQKTD